LTINMPEMHDSDWDWAEFVAKNNGELLNNWGNLVNRVLSFSFKHWEGHVPDIDSTTLRPADNALLASIESGFESVGGLLEGVKLRAALQEAFRLSKASNEYLSAMEPWQTIKTDKASTALTIFTALKAVDSLKVLFAPFLPFTCEKLNGYLGYETSLFGEAYTELVRDSLGEHTVLRYRGNAGSFTWKPSALLPRSKLNQPAPLFKKLEDTLVEEERSRLGK